MISPLRPHRPVRRPGRRPPLSRHIRFRPGKRLAGRIHTGAQLRSPIDQAAARHEEREYGRLALEADACFPLGAAWWG
jgi:hypothetical protein